MYVDESGSNLFDDLSNYFVVTGVILHENEGPRWSKRFREFKENWFEKNAVIHAHDIHRGKNMFKVSNVKQRKPYLISCTRYSIILT